MFSFLTRMYATFTNGRSRFEYNPEGYYVHPANRNREFKVSVVMPVYNAEKTLRKTIDSVIRQTIGFENIEFLILDDKSTDNSRPIIMEYARSYSNIVPVFLKAITVLLRSREMSELIWQKASISCLLIQMTGSVKTELKSYTNC